MKIRSIVFAGMVAGAVALAVAGCTGTTAVGEGQGAGRGAQGAQGGGRYLASAGAGEIEGVVGRGAGRGTQSFPTETVDPASDRTGRDVADTGELKALSGELAEVDGEWYLEAADGRYLLHMGNQSFVEQTGIDLDEGEKVEVRGLVDGEEVSVVSMVSDGQTYAFRAEDGTPLWAGNGRGSAGGGRTGASAGAQGSGRGGQGGGRGRTTSTDA